MAALCVNGRPRKQTGFTLTELLIVLLIVGLLAAIVGPSLYQKINPARQATARAQIKNLSTALDGFFVDVGRYPTEREGLEALFYQPDGMGRWLGPYVKKEIPNDPWGHPYLYRVPGSHGPFDIISYGADGIEGGEGENRDINNWQSP